MKTFGLCLLRASVLSCLVGLGVGMAGNSYAQTASIVATARSALPAGIRDADVLKVATSLQWPPFDYTKNGKPEGIDIRLVELLAAKLGLKPRFADLKFPAIVPGVSSGRFDIGVDQIGITPERAKVVDFVPYFNSGYGLLTRKGDTALDINNLCGKSLVITQGSSQVEVANDLSAQCVKSDHAKIGLIFFPNSADTYLALANGRGDGFLTARAVGMYIARDNSKLAMASGMMPGTVSVAGIVVRKGNAPLMKALTLAMESAISDGSYANIMASFGVPEGAITENELLRPAQR